MGPAFQFLTPVRIRIGFNTWPSKEEKWPSAKKMKAIGPRYIVD